jgi:hypothetical protein
MIQIIENDYLPANRYVCAIVKCRTGQKKSLTKAMTLASLKTISGLLIVLFFSCKVIIHYYLDYKHNKSASFLYSLLTPLHYFQSYKTTVDFQFINLKSLCNLLLVLTFISLILNIIFGVTLLLN